MAPIKAKSRSEVGVKQRLMTGPVSKRKADESPLKPPTTTQVKRHFIEDPVKENVLFKSKAQLQGAITAKKPLSMRNVNTQHSLSTLLGKDNKFITNLKKKDALVKEDSKENIVTRMSQAKISSVGSKTTKTTTLVTLKTRTTTTVEVKKPVPLKDIQRVSVKPDEPKAKPKVDVKPQVKEAAAPSGKVAVVNRRTSFIPVNTVKTVCCKKSEPPVRTTGPVTRLSLNKTANRKSSDGENTLYETALEDVLDDSGGTKKSVKAASLVNVKERRKRPPGVEDFDVASQDLFSVGKYAFQIFEYYKSREGTFKVNNYIVKQKNISKSMRAVLVDWLADIQENFELNHETLYLAVKIIDLYLSKVMVQKDHLQLLGATAMLIACKYDERIPPLLDDFIDVSNRSFSAEDVMSMEGKVLKTIGYDLGAPLSYRFLRRYARCAGLEMPTLTLARYILELSLMEYTMALESESKLACASLYLALRMKDRSHWTPTLQYYSGYKLLEFKELVMSLNTMLHQKPRDNLTIRKKYSHEVFFKVALIPLLDKVDFPANSS